MPRFVDVAVPVALDQAFTYLAPAALEDLIAPGMRILVPFGRRVLVGVVLGWRDDAPVEKVKEVLDVLDDPGQPALLPSILKLCAWISDYYLSPIGEVCRLALPGALAAGAVNCRRRRAYPEAQAAQALLLAVLMHRALQVALQMCLSLEDVATVLAAS